MNDNFLKQLGEAPVNLLFVPIDAATNHPDGARQIALGLVMVGIGIACAAFLSRLPDGARQIALGLVMVGIVLFFII